MMPSVEPNNLPLRDIHLPGSSLWWPPAPGWWLLLLLGIIIVLVCLFLLKKRKANKLSAIFIAEGELQRIQQQFATEQDRILLIRELSELIRRLSISQFARVDTAALTGEAWLQFLDKLMDDMPFSQGVGRALVDAPYQQHPEFDSQALLKLVEIWIERVSKHKDDS